MQDLPPRDSVPPRRRPGALRAALLLLGIAVGAPGFAAEDSAPTGPAGYFKLHPDFVVNLYGESGPHFLLAAIQVMSRDPETLKAAEHHLPALRHELLLLLSEQKYPAVGTPQSRVGLQQAGLDAVNSVLERETGARRLEGLFFTEFVVE